MACQMENRWSKLPNTDVSAVVALGIPPNVRLGIRLLVFAPGWSSGGLMPVTLRVALSSEGAMVTPPRPAPKMNSLAMVGLMLFVSEMVGMLPGPFLRSVMVRGQFQ